MTGVLRPLSRRQSMIWAGQKLDPDAPLYNMIFTFALGAELDVRAFERAHETLVAGCDVLRSVIVERDGLPLLETLVDVDPVLDVVDLGDVPDHERAVRSWAIDRGQQPFDLATCLLDSVLVKAGDGYTWFLNQHHLIADAWSASLLLRYQGDLYLRALAGTLDEAAPLPGYAAFLDAETADLASPAYDDATAFWRERLADPPEPLDFGVAPGDVGTATVRVEAPIRGERAARLADFLARPGIAAISPELTVLRVFQTVLFAHLHRRTGNERLAIGTPFHNRTTRRFKETPGLFMNLYPVNVDVARDATMQSLMHQVGEQIFEGLRHARFPLERTLEADAFPVVLNYIHATFDRFAGSPCRAEWVHCGHADRGHAIRLQVLGDPTTGVFDLFFDLKADVFDDDARRRVVRQFRRVLDAWLDDPDVALAQLELIDPEDRERCVEQFNAVAPMGDTPAVVELFEAQAKSSPHATAVRAGRIDMTFEALNRGANELAHTLLARGVDNGDVVALVMRPSPEALVAILGTLKAGAAYVPLDPATPAARLGDVLTDTRASLVLTAGNTVRLPSGVEALDLTSLDTAPAGDNPGRAVAPESTAYVIFTSGSTGRPKGVPVSHRGLANYVAWARSHYCGDRACDMAFFTSLAFDLTVTSVFVPLVSGGAAVCYNDDDATGTPAVVEVFRDDRVDIVKATPSHLAVVRALGLSPKRLETLIVGGEDFGRDLADAIDAQLEHRVDIFNEYGPTEAVVGCMIHRFDADRDRGASVPIGRPAAGARIYLLDDHLRPVPVGGVGEIYIGGPGVVDGYLDRPDLTDERFVDRPAHLRSPADPDHYGDRLYRTGDRARWIERDDGTVLVDYLGRSDDQVKVRGHRVELGEIESALVEHDSIAEAAVVLASGAAAERPVVADATVDHCARCGLPSNYPDVVFEAGVCSLCTGYDTYRSKVDEYFRDRAGLEEIAASIKASRSGGKYDCLVLLSGGKDSTYMLYQVAELGLRPLVFTLDNGFISEGAKQNCRRVTDDLGFDLVIGSTPHMNEIFVDSLERFSNVCHGCFKTIYTLAVNLAREHGLGHIFTGLSRGQLFETRLSDMYNHQIYDVDQIDQFVLDARKAYHRLDDAVSRRLDVEVFRDDAVFDEIVFVDYYRYTDVPLEHMLSFLDERAPWVRPSDTGRSTNCLINDVGIYIHKRERGYHNYAFPYAWDVRLGHKQREAALDELDDDIDEEYVRSVLVEIGYEPKSPGTTTAPSRLVAYYVSPDEIEPSELRRFLGESLPDYMVPADFVRLDQLPLGRSGKLDRKALQSLARPGPRTVVDVEIDAAHQDAAEVLIEVWREIFGRPDIGLGDNFFDLGGDSIIGIQIVARASEAGLSLQPRQLFDEQTVARLAAVAEQQAEDLVQADQGRLTGDTPLLPIQADFFDAEHPNPHHWNQMIRLAAPPDLQIELVEKALTALVDHHDALRLRFRPDPDEGGWRQEFTTATPIEVRRLDLSTVDPTAHTERTAEAVGALNRSLDLTAGPVFGALHVAGGAEHPSQLIVTAHHLVVDGVSWYPLVADLDAVYDQLSRGEAPDLPRKTASVRQWADAVREAAPARPLEAARRFWSAQHSPVAAAPHAELPRFGAVRRLAAHLDRDITEQLLHEAHAAYGTAVNELLLTALVRTERRLGRAASPVDIESHGRDALGSEIDVSRTVGWFTAVAPLVLEGGRSGEIGDDIKAVKEAVREASPHLGGFGMLRRHADDAALMAQLSGRQVPTVSFNYLGRLDLISVRTKRFTLIDGLELSCDPNNFASHAIELAAWLEADRLRIDLAVDRSLVESGDAQSMVDTYVAELEAIVSHCIAAEDREYTPSDFEAARLDQSQLDRLGELLDG